MGLIKSRGSHCLAGCVILFGWGAEVMLPGWEGGRLVGVKTTGMEGGGWVKLIRQGKGVGCGAMVNGVILLW